MKNWGFLSALIGFFRHSHLPLSLHIADPKHVLFAAGALFGVLLYFSGIFLVVPNLISILWPWRIKNFFSTSLSHWYLVQDISWLTACKLLIFLVVLWTIFKGIHSELRE